MPSESMIAAQVVIAILGAALLLAAHAAWRRRTQLMRLRDRWGKKPASPRPIDDRAAQAWRELQRPEDRHAAIDEGTWSDLDLDTVLASIDRTSTALGRQLLYWRLRSGAAWRDAPVQEELVGRCTADIGVREAIGLRLAAAGSSLGNGLWVITRPDLILVRWWYWSFPLLAFAMIGGIATIPFHPRALLFVLALVVVNLAVRMATAWQIPGLLAPMRQLGPLIATAEQLLRTTATGLPHDDHIATDVRDLQPLRRIAQWVSRDALASGEIAAALWEYLNLLFILDANALLLSARRLRILAPALARVAAWVGDVDVALSVAALRAESADWCVPVWADLQTTSVVDLWHPLLAAAVPSEVELRAGTGLIVTGANMSGKSTYLRAVGIAAVLARALDTCPAKSWRGRAFRVRSLIGRQDDLAAGKSYYQVEADRVVALLAAAADPEPTLFLLDELLRGTNTVERLAAGEAVLRALLQSRPGGTPHVVLVATHDGELVAMLADEYRPYHFRETIVEGGLHFDYRRRAGPATTRTAIALLEITGAPPAVIAAARARADQLDTDAGRVLPRDSAT